MNTLVFNLDSLAVTEYTTLFTGLSGDVECTASGVFRVGGAMDDDQKIPSAFSFGLVLSESGKQQRAKYLYLHGTGSEGATAVITDGAGKSFSYKLQPRHDKVSRFVLGAGIRDNYLAAELRFTGTNPLRIDRLEFETVESATRRM